MVDFMPWALKQRVGFFLAVILPVVLGLTYLNFPSSLNFSDTDATDQNPVVIVASDNFPLTCFETSTSFLWTSQDEFCGIEFISLGNSPLTESATASGEITQTHPLLLARFAAAAQIAQLDGVNLYISSSFRSKERQAYLFAREVRIRGSETEAAKWVLPADSSHHPQGLALDINYPGDPAEAAWLESNGARFGLCRVYANEWWHFEGVIAPGQSCPAMAQNALADRK